MNASSLARVLSACLALVIGCGDGGGSDAGTDASSITGDAGFDAERGLDSGLLDGGPSGEIADYCRPLAEAVCTAARDCDCGEVLPGGVLDVAACTARWQASCEEAWGPFVAAGARVDPARAAACVAIVEDASPECGTPSAVAAFGLCEPFVIDPASIGEACASPYCAGGAGVCARDGDGRTCAMRGAVGASCEDMFSCATGLVCFDGTCSELGEAGAPCRSDLACRPPMFCGPGGCTMRLEVGGICNDTRDCAHGLVCDDTERCVVRAGTTCDDTTECGSLEQCASPPTCRAPLSLGGACRDNADCAASLYCEVLSRACVARPTDGMACANGVICAPGTGCDMDGGGTCRTLGGAAGGGPGSPCLLGEFGPFLCAEGLACSSGVCTALPTEGQPCAGTDTCAAGLGCAFGPEGSICIEPRGEGEPCENRQACREDLHCGSAGTCTADVALGNACNPGLGDCGGACVPDASGGFVCSARLAEGATCVADEDCTSELTCLVRPEDTRCLAEICSSL